MSTMREESWPEPDVVVTGQGYHEHAYSVRLVRQIAEAAYAAGQRDGGDWRLAIDGELVGLEIGVAEPSSDARERLKKLIESYVSLGTYEERERCLRALEAEMPTQSMHLIEHRVYANALRDGMRAIRARDKEQG